MLENNITLKFDEKTITMRYGGGHAYKSETAGSLDISTMPTPHLLAAYRKGVALQTIDPETVSAMRHELELRHVDHGADHELSQDQAARWAKSLWPRHRVSYMVHGSTKSIGVMFDGVLHSGSGETWLAALRDLMDRTGRTPRHKEQ